MLRPRSALPPGLSGLPPCLPFVPLLRARHAVGQLATQILNEPSVPGSEATHTTAHAAGVQAWLSPWQVRRTRLAARAARPRAPGPLLWLRACRNIVSRWHAASPPSPDKRAAAALPHKQPNVQADLLLEAADQLLSDALQLRRSFIQDILAPSVGPRVRAQAPTAAQAALAVATHAARDGAAPRPPPPGGRPRPLAGPAAVAAAAALIADEATGLGGGGARPAARPAAGKGSSFLLDVPMFELLVFCCLPAPDSAPGARPGGAGGGGGGYM